MDILDNVLKGTKWKKISPFLVLEEKWEYGL
jgi:hypothetical protein